MANQREDSKRNWSSNGRIEEINSGSLQRIADATEVMAQNYVQLQNDRDMYKRWWQEQQERTEKLRRRVAALQGVITKMKNKATGEWKTVPVKK